MFFKHLNHAVSREDCAHFEHCSAPNRWRPFTELKTRAELFCHVFLFVAPPHTTHVVAIKLVPGVSCDVAMSSIRRKHVKVVGDQNRIGHRWHRLTDRSQSIASFGHEGLHHWVVGEGATAAQIVWFGWFYDEKKPKSGVLTMKNVDLTDEQWKMRLSNSMVCPDVRSISIGKMTINHAIFGGWTHFSYHLLGGDLSTIRHLQLDTGLTGNLW